MQICYLYYLITYPTSCFCTCQLINLISLHSGKGGVHSCVLCECWLVLSPGGAMFNWSGHSVGVRDGKSIIRGHRGTHSSHRVTLCQGRADTLRPEWLPSVPSTAGEPCPAVSTVHAECHTSAHLTTHRYTGTWSVWGPLVSGHYLGNTHMTSYLPEEFYWHVNRDISFLVIYIHGFMCHLYFGW